MTRSEESHTDNVRTTDRSAADETGSGTDSTAAHGHKVRLTSQMFVSLDGVIQGPGGPEEDTRDGFDQGGWVVPYVDEGFGAIVDGWFADAGAFLFGRTTFDMFAGHWPHVTDPEDTVASMLNRLPKYLVSSTPDVPAWQNTHLVEGDLTSAITALTTELGTRPLAGGPSSTLQIHGSGRLVTSLLELGLVDELRLMTFPVALGTGQRLFPSPATPTAWTLTDTRTTAAGVIAQTYVRAGDATTGDIVIDDDGKEQILLD